LCCSASRSFRIDGCAGSHCSRLNYHADIETFDATSRTVARQLMKKDALAAHARDELGLTEELAARPLQAALASAATFAVGAAVPILTIVLAPTTELPIVVSIVSLICLAALGAIAGRAGGASAVTGAVRVAFWGALAMAMTAAVGRLFGIAVG